MYELKKIELADMEAIRVARNEQIDVLRQKHPISKEEQIAYFNNAVAVEQAKKNPQMILYSLFKDGLWIGYGGLVHIDWEHKRAEVSFLVATARAQDEKLYAQDFSNFLKLLTKIAFVDLKLHRLYTETFAFRKEHIQILEKFGFKKEGVLKEHLLIKGIPHHSIMHGLLAKEVLK